MMSSDYFVYNIGAFVIGLVLTVYLTVPFSVWLAKRVGAIDLPGDLKVHDRPIPRMGGVGIVLTFLLISIFSALVYSADLNLKLKAAVGGTIAIFLLGVLDDIRDLPQTLKFAFEGLIALGMVWVLADALTWWLAVAVWLGLVGMVNAYNFIDGLDGLAGGTAAINFAALSALCFVDDEYLLSLLALACTGACLGFLRFNWQPARVFMGDGGALGLGFLIAALSVLYIDAGDWSWNRIVAVILAAALPVGDLILTFVRRLAVLRSLRPGDLFPGDRFHFYDQMKANVGLSTRTTVIICYRAALGLAALGIAAYLLPAPAAAIAGLLGVVLLILLAIRYKIGIPKLEGTKAK